jgi:WD40 repeat protein
VIEYSDFVWRVFIVLSPKPLVVAYVSAEDKIQVSDLHTGETVNEISGRLIFSGSVALWSKPVVIIASGEDDVSFIDVTTSQIKKVIKGGFEKAFRAVVSPSPDPHFVFTTWNAQKRRSTIQTYALTITEGTDNQNSLSASQSQTHSQVHSRSNSISTMAESGHIRRSSSPSFSSQLFGPPSSLVNLNAPHEEEVDRNRMVALFEGDSRDGVTSLVVTLFNTPIICSGHYDGKIRLWSIQTKTLINVLEGEFTLPFSMCCEVILTCFPGHDDSVYSVAAWKGNQPLLVSGSCDRTVKVWNIQSGELITTGKYFGIY